MHPIEQTRDWQAFWIWAPGLYMENNVHVLARREFSLASIQGDAVVRITANSRYRLWINGIEVGRGPSPSYPRWQYYDSYEVTEHLREGVNVLAVHAYCFGPSMVSVLTQDPGPGGLLLELEVAGRVVVVSDDAWRTLRDPSRAQHTEPISGHRGGFKERCDLRAEVIGWRDPGFDDRSWPTAEVLGAALGTPPWENLISREIPPLRLEPVPPRDVFFHSRGCTYGGPKEVTGPAALRHDDETCTVVTPLNPQDNTVLILDFGRDVVGFFELEIADCAGGVMDIAYGESLNVTDVDRVVLRPGRQTYSPFERRAGRYVVLTLRDLGGPVRIRHARWLQQSYPVEPRGEFSCSDRRLNQIWDVGRYTVQLCMQDHYEDCPWREQTLYTGDLAVSAPLSYYAFGTDDLSRKCLRQMARLQDADGLIPMLGPAPSNLFYVPEYPAAWVHALWAHWQHWGDEALVRELLPNLERCLGWYENRTGDDGLFRPRAGDNCRRFVDNLCGVAYDEVDSDTDLVPEQMIIAGAFQRAAQLVQALGLEPLASRWAEHGARMAQAINARYWRTDIRAYGAPDGSDTVIPLGSIANGLAALFGIAQGARLRDALQYVLDQETVAPLKAGYMNGYVTEAFFVHGQGVAGLSRLRDYWGGMIERGATTFWEVFDPTTSEGTLPHWSWSLCHAFCAAPVRLLPAYVAGIRPLDPGFSRVLIAPCIADLHWVRATVPTPRGDIRVVVTRVGDAEELEVEACLPAGVAAELVLPFPRPETRSVWLNGRPLLGDGVAALREVAPLLSALEMEHGLVRLHLEASVAPHVVRGAARSTGTPVHRGRMTEAAIIP